ncbi:hypothetical protein GV791_26700 [Nocardia cyriacigeorgica]|uniref:Uncharacterized protein n=1 Tax=Nocardia cyriacigeorgica TaxID=135487 RepID=A0A6P1CW99_9NOCA|nr:DUF6186 family protein [Nocardia cyriacigeorgica]MBF6083590.1 hypothetical protein [Nocardia cyriacigeorgica]MBF6425662.1 hypothetical protein [Nocardia cyriacigeorgica]NEW36127.1 hypothetical protein [Nocardia cyriacigeorgica]BDU04775.1 hypothetical protein FMUBM48_10380 [Nocardia cyriacigeorgica]
MSERAIIITGFAILAGIALTLTLVAHLRRDALAPLGTVIALALRTRTARLIMLPVWVWLGWHFLAR